MFIIIGFTSLNISDDNAANVKKDKKVVKNVIKKPIINMKAKPSCRSCCRMKYKWYNHKFINYCPHCKRYNTLLKNPKRTYEKEYTCKRCGADYCAVCGHDKHSNKRIHRNYVLKRA